MLESVALISGGGGYYPDSGPGPKSLLRGDTDLGYFGRVTQEELFTGQELVTYTKIAATNLSNANMLWVKFFYHGRVVYFPTQPIANSINFNTIYNAGVAFGVRGPGPYPSVPNVEQLTFIPKTDEDRTWQLLIRLPKITDTDIGPPSSGVEVTYGELYQLVPNVLVKASGSWPVGNASWDNIPEINLDRSGSMVYSCTMNSVNTAQPLAGGRELKPTIMGIGRTGTYTAMGWHPMLELVSKDDYAFDVEDVATLLEGIAPVEPLPARTSQAGFLPVSRIAVELIGGTEPVFETGFTDTILNLKEINTEVEGMTDPMITVGNTNATMAIHGFAIETLVAQPQMTVTINNNVSAIFGVTVGESPIPVSFV